LSPCPIGNSGTTFAKVVNEQLALKRRKYNTASNVHGTPEERAAIEAQAEEYRQAKAGDEDAGSSLWIANERRLKLALRISPRTVAK
jgi:hypothetical protein